MKVLDGGCSKSEQSGATLVELVMTIVIISVAIAGVVGAFSLVSGRSANSLFQTRAVELGQFYMDEILAQKYDDATPVGGVPPVSDCNISAEEGSNRSAYDDVDDYDAIDNAPPRTAEGTPLPGYDGFEVSVTVFCAGSEVGLPDLDAKRIDLSITGPADSEFSLSAYRANF
ncbi:type IV pilus modification PilV family protein [Vreelandella utahensis]|uniref:type IV pilus modification PilV family protein n=1 Tax=Vreelandella halophila TaxID=86177 RepID=UPI00098681B0|nr:type II secretion system protein [Halomonas utahensis]